MFTIYVQNQNAFINFKNEKNDEKVRAINYMWRDFSDELFPKKYCIIL